MTTHAFTPATTYLTDVGAANAYVSIRGHDALELMRKLLCECKPAHNGIWMRVYYHVIIRAEKNDDDEISVLDKVHWHGPALVVALEKPITADGPDAPATKVACMDRAW